MMYHNSIELDSVMPFANESKLGFIIGYDAPTTTFKLKHELRVWLKARPHHISYKRLHNGAYLLYLNFFEHSDMLLFKLTWGGK